MVVTCFQNELTNCLSVFADCVLGWVTSLCWRQPVPLAVTLTATSCFYFRASHLTTASFLTSSSPLRPAFWSTLYGTSSTSELTGKASLQHVKESVCQTVIFHCSSHSLPHVVVICLHLHIKVSQNEWNSAPLSSPQMLFHQQK